MSTFKLPAGRYYIGDPCYVIREEDWNKVCDEMFKDSEDFECMIIKILEKPFFIGRTAYGDGTYRDQENHQYGVDSGSLGAVPVEIIKNLGIDMFCYDFPNGLVITYKDGNFDFGGIVINTNWEKTEDEEAYKDYN